MKYINESRNCKFKDYLLILTNNPSISEGSVLSPFLVNIDMTELDKSIESLKLK